MKTDMTSVLSVVKADGSWNASFDMKNRAYPSEPFRAQVLTIHPSVSDLTVKVDGEVVRAEQRGADVGGGYRLTRATADEPYDGGVIVRESVEIHGVSADEKISGTIFGTIVEEVA